MKDLNICILLDFYASLLTPKQKEMMEQYYNEDLSLSEIAEGMNISRQGVRDAIKKGESIIKTAEAEMGFVARFMSMAEELSVVRNRVVELIENKTCREEKLNSLLKEVDNLRTLSGVTDYGI